MKSGKGVTVAYWIATGLFALLMAFSATQYLTNDAMRAGFTHLGFPSYFRVELAIAKLLGVVALLVPFRGWFKEWAYAGFAITLVSAFVAHVNSGDSAGMFMAPVIAGAVLGISYMTFRKRSLALLASGK
jgi:hypothetical protein